MGIARDVIPGLGERMILHAGPPITWDRMCGPQRGAVMGAAVYEGWAASYEEAAAMAAAGEFTFAPCHHFHAVGPMAGIVSPSMPVFIVRNETFGNTTYSTQNEGLGRVLRYGAYGDEVLARLKWMETTLYPALKAVLQATGPIDLRSLLAQALHMGDEGHNRNRAGTSLLIRQLAPTLIERATKKSRRRSAKVHRRQRSLFPQPLDGGGEGDAGTGGGDRGQLHPHGDGAQRHGFRHPRGGDAGTMVHRARAHRAGAVAAGLLREGR